MQAIQFSQTGDASVLQLVDIPKPTPKPGQILVRNRFAGVNFIDTYFRTGLYKAALPSSLGQEASGEVSAIGDGVTDFSVGDQVAYLANTDAYAQFAAAPSDSAVKLPAGVSLETGAATLIQALTAHTMVTRTYKVQPGDWVLVHAGAGGTGRLLIQLSKHLGANVIATVSTDDKAKVARAAGADHIIMYSHESVPERVHEIVPEGVHAVFDGVGKSTFEGSLESLRRLGTMVSFGNASGAVPPVDLFKLSAKNLALLRPRLFGYIVTKEEKQHHMGEVFKLIDQGKLDIQVSGVYDLKDVAQAHEDLEGRKTTGKLIIRIP
ncbi:hypothetical protein EC988_001164 [Linderina pennispora]|nr:hypothetical protein EC988_001164 [Linderina pennispora]